jgi:catechol 2,3-dioxygenase-like lactoylglutathione lyase family enzyme
MDRLGDRVNHISHVDVNVSDAERSRRFYEATMPVEAVARIEGHGSYPSLGIEDGQFVGYVLRNVTQLGDYPLLRLIEWQRPRPVAGPYISHGNVGWYRLVATVRDMDRARDAVIASGGHPFTETSTGVLLMYGPKVEPNPYRTFHAHDPDGITIQWSYDWPREDQTRVRFQADERPEQRFMAEKPVQDRIFALVGGTTDVDGSARLFVDVLGLDIMAGLQTPEQVPNVYSPSGGQTVCDGAFFVPRGDRRFVIDWLRWFESSANPVPYAEPHHIGIIRCGIEVDDIDRAYEHLCGLAAAGDPSLGDVYAPEVWPMGPDVGEQRVVNFTNSEGVMFQLVAAPPYPLGSLHPWGAEAIDFGAPDVTRSTGAVVDSGVRRP